MVKNQKSVFWKAGILTLIIFLLGILFGAFIESTRTTQIKENYESLEFQLLDSKLKTDFYQLIDKDFCEFAIEDNLKFSNMIYEEGKKIEIYDQFNKLNKEALKREKKKYAFLKVEFWMNSLILKEKCNTDYVHLLYFYEDDPSLSIVKQEQKAQSDILIKLKEKYGASLILIPLPTNLDISIISGLIEINNIQKTPTLLLEENLKLEGIHSIEEIESFL
jgi:hypothetical protein